MSSGILKNAVLEKDMQAVRSFLHFLWGSLRLRDR